MTTSDILNAEVDVGRMTSSASEARSRCLLPTGPRFQIDPGTRSQHKTSAHIINIILHFLSAVFTILLLLELSCQQITNKIVTFGNRFLKVTEAISGKNWTECICNNAREVKQVGYKEQNTQTVDKNTDNQEFVIRS